jgi:hypothetical protein
MFSREVVVLVTGAAMYPGDAVAIGTSPHTHRVPMLVVSLAGKVSVGMAIHTSWIVQHWKHGFKCADGRTIIARRRCFNFAVITARRDCLNCELKYEDAGHDH